jgi:hypothetical protein
MAASNHKLRQAFHRLNDMVIADVDADVVIDSLVAGGVLGRADRSTLDDMAPGTCRTRWMLALINASRHPTAFVALRRAIESEPSYSRLAEELDRICCGATSPGLMDSSTSREWKPVAVDSRAMNEKGLI